MDAKELTKIVNDHSNRLREDEKRIDYLEQEVQKLRMLLDDLRVEVAMCTHNIGRGAEDMRYILNIDDRTGEATIHPYEAGEVFKRGYDMGEAQGRRSANGVEAAEVEKAVELYRKSLAELVGLGDVDRKMITGYMTIEAIISDISADALLECMERYAEKGLIS